MIEDTPAPLFSRTRSVLLWDGAMGTGLVERGLVLAQEAPESWLWRRPDEIRALSAGFVAAGAEVVQTCSFGLVRLGLLADEGRALGVPQVRQAAQRSVQCAQQAFAGRRRGHVVGSLGPTGQREPGAGRVRGLTEELSGVLAQAGVDAIHLETQLVPAELAAMLAGVAAGAPGVPIVVSLTLSLSATGGLETPLGVPVLRMLHEVTRALSAGMSIAAIGANCGLPARKLRRVVRELRAFADEQRSDLWVLAQPEIDQPAPDCKRPAAPEEPARFAADMMTLLDEGADAIGGCCGCDAGHLAALNDRLATRQQKSEIVD